MRLFVNIEKHHVPRTKT